MTSYQFGDTAIVSPRFSVYRNCVAANSVTGCGSLSKSRRISSAKETIEGAFFTPEISFYGGCARGTFGCAGFLDSQSSTPAHSCRPLRGSDAGSSPKSGASPMTKRRILSLNPSKSRAAAHRAMALAALHADSSLSVRLKRYNAHMEIARTLETEGVAA